MQAGRATAPPLCGACLLCHEVWHPARLCAAVRALWSRSRGCQLLCSTTYSPPCAGFRAVVHNCCRLACQELLGVDSADTTFVVERARQAVARKHRRKSGLGPVVHRGATNDVPTMEFPLATFLVQAKLPMFWTQFLAGVQNSYALQASQGDAAVDARRRSSAAKDGRRRSSGVRRGAGTATAPAGT